MAGKWDDEDILSDINVTPLVDIMLVLLIIFMVTTTFLLTPAIPVQVPRASTADDPPAKAFALVLDREGNLYLNGKKTTPEDASTTLKNAVAQDPKVQALVAADGEIDYQSVIRVIDLVKSAGVSNFALNVQRE